MQNRMILQKILCLICLFTCALPVGVYAQQSSTSASLDKKEAALLTVDFLGVDEIDAQSAAMLVAAEFRKHGIRVTDPVLKEHKSGDVYRLSFQRLGEKVLVRLVRDVTGMAPLEKELWIDNIEEMIKASPRLVDAIVHNKPIASTAVIDTVTGYEATPPKKLTGESLWNMGIFGTFLPGTDIFGKPGYEFGWSYQAPLYAVGTEFRFSGGTGSEEDFFFASWSIGGRYFFNDKNISPYVGGGFSIFGASYTDYGSETYDGYYDDYYYYGYTSDDDSGLAAYLVGGVEMLRLTKSRLKVEIRVDRPFFSLSHFDIMPITFGLFFSQHFVPGGCLLF